MIAKWAGGIAMDKLDPIGDAEFFGPEFCLLAEQLAHVYAGADDAVILCPGAQHLPRTAAEVEHPGSGFQAQRRAEGGELFGGDRVVDAVGTFSNVEYPGDVHGGKSPWLLRALHHEEGIAIVVRVLAVNF